MKFNAPQRNVKYVALFKHKILSSRTQREILFDI